MRTIFVNLIAFIIVLLLLYFGTTMFLKNYTRYGESITVADFRGMTVSQLDDYIKNKPLKYKVIDSSFVNNKLPGAILEQAPEPGEKVKRDRRIYLTVNAKVPPKTEMPDLKDSSLKNAKIQLENHGLLLGETTYQPCLGKNTILNVTVDGKTVEKETRIFKGTEVDLVLCDGIGNKPIAVPELVGLTYNEAIAAIRLSQLSIGAVFEGDDVIYKESSFVYKQAPYADGSRTIKIGEPVDLFLQQEAIMSIDNFDDVYDEYEFDNREEEVKPIDFSDPTKLPESIMKKDSVPKQIEGEQIDFNNLDFDNIPADLIKKDSTQTTKEQPR